MIIEATPESVLFGALGILAATASTVAASVSRQENLSGRMRTLCKEFRDLDYEARKETVPSPERQRRLKKLPEQILEFRERLRHCIRAHMCLYTALTLEAVAFGSVFFAQIDSFWRAQPAHKSAIVALALVAGAFVLLIVGLANHILEYKQSNLTLDLELSDLLLNESWSKPVAPTLLQASTNPLTPVSAVLPNQSQSGSTH